MKLTKHAWALWALALIAVIAMAIIIPFVRNTVWWVSAFCTLLMFCLCAFTFYRAFRRDKMLVSKLLGFSIFKVGTVALLVQIIAGFIIMGLSTVCPIIAAVSAELVIFIAAGFCLTVKDAAVDAITQTENGTELKTAGWKAIRLKANAVAAQTESADIKRLAEQIRFADPVCTSIDSELDLILDKLSVCPDAETVKQAFTLLERRKTLAKSEKAKKA